MRPSFRFDWPACGEGAALTLGLIETDHAGIGLRAGPGTPIIPLPAIEGAIIGYLFDRSGRHRRHTLTTAEQLAIFSTKGRHLVERYSGAYVAIWIDPSNGSICVLRDPSGMMPALAVTGDGRIVVMSDLALTPDMHLAVDPDELARILWHPGRAAACQPLAGVTEILPGELWRCADGQVERTPCWSPWAFVSGETGLFDQHARRLMETVDDVVSGWASLGPVCLELSGGLDSSILAAALARTGQPWQAITFATEARDGDERPHARLVASHTGTTLEELLLFADPADAVRPLERLLARPSGMAIMRGIDQLVQHHAPDGHILFSGGGGDNVFAMLSSTGPIRDAWQREGPHMAWTVADEIARLHGGTRRQVLARLVRRLWRDVARIEYPGSDQFLRPIGRLKPPDHPWFSRSDRQLPGAAAHISSIAMVQTVLDAHDRYTTRTNIFPLLSQSVMEACLSVPSYFWSRGGHDRAVARAAFAERLPSAILARRTKGRLESLLAAIYDGARAQLRSLLLDGRLASYGLLDTPAVESVLGRVASNRDWKHARILQLADAELWVRSIEARA